MLSHITEIYKSYKAQIKNMFIIYIKNSSCQKNYIKFYAKLTNSLPVNNIGSPSIKMSLVVQRLKTTEEVYDLTETITYTITQVHKKITVWHFIFRFHNSLIKWYHLYPFFIHQETKVWKYWATCLKISIL